MTAQLVDLASARARFAPKYAAREACLAEQRATVAEQAERELVAPSDGRARPVAGGSRDLAARVPAGSPRARRASHVARHSPPGRERERHPGWLRVDRGLPWVPDRNGGPRLRSARLRSVEPPERRLLPQPARRALEDQVRGREAALCSRGGPTRRHSPGRARGSRASSSRASLALRPPAHLARDELEAAARAMVTGRLESTPKIIAKERWEIEHLCEHLRRDRYDVGAKAGKRFSEAMRLRLRRKIARLEEQIAVERDKLQDNGEPLPRRAANCSAPRLIVLADTSSGFRYKPPVPNTQRLAEFTAWCEKNITGDEKGQAQIFLDRLFQAFDQPGCLGVGGSTEFRIRKADEDGGGTSFADYVWKPVVLVEMKRRGENLQKHFRQAFDYWTRSVPSRPRYVVLCNFDEFRVYDFDTDLDTPKDTVTLKDLPKRWGPLAFLAPGSPKPTFENDREKVTREAADCLAECFRKLVKRNVPREDAQRFILQILVAVFAEDIDLLPKYFVTQILDDCSTPASAYDLIGGLFEAMNTDPPKSGGRFKGVSYFNGGLFREPARLEIHDSELALLRKAARFDWSKVQPEVFGTLFEHTVSGTSDADESDDRRKYGAHFTHPSDIMKIVGPTIVEPWREQVEKAKTLRDLYQLTDRLHRFRVLDPACGSGNFLYIAYRELKRVEARIFERMETEFKSEAKRADQRRLSFLSAQNF